MADGEKRITWMLRARAKRGRFWEGNYVTGSCGGCFNVCAFAPRLAGKIEDRCFSSCRYSAVILNPSRYRNSVSSFIHSVPLRLNI